MSQLPGRPPVEPYLHGLSDRDPPETYVAWREEVAAWRDIAKTARETRRAGFGGSYPSIDLVRKLGQRIGFLEGLLRETALRE